MVGKEEMGGITIFFPEHMWAEPHYNFFQIYREECADKMRDYKGIIEMMKKDLKEDDNKIKEKIKRKEKEEKERKKREAKEKEESEKIKEKVDEKIEKAKIIEDKSKEQIMKLCYEMHHDESIDLKDRTYRKIGKKFELNHITVKRYVEKYSKIIEKEDGEDFEDKVLEDLEGDTDEENRN